MFHTRSRHGIKVWLVVRSGLPGTGILQFDSWDAGAKSWHVLKEHVVIVSPLVGTFAHALEPIEILYH
jgi:hypothetical protein